MSCIQNFKSQFFWFNVFRSGHKRAMGTNAPLSFWLLLFSWFYSFENLVCIFVDFKLFLVQRLLYLSSKFLSTFPFQDRRIFWSQICSPCSLAYVEQIR